LVCAACTFSVPRPTGVTVSVRAQVRTEARVQVVPPAPAVVLLDAPVVEFFGIPLDGAQDVVFVLDRSGSMSELVQGKLVEVATAPVPAQRGQVAGSRKIDVAQAELVEALARLEVGTRMNVIFFADGVEAFFAGLAPLEGPSRDGMMGYVEATAADGATALGPALRTAFLMNAGRIVLLSDGLGNIGGSSRDILRDARAAMRGGVRIDTIGIGAGHDAALLATLASESGGLYQPF